jgi:hypothetical protein
VLLRLLPFRIMSDIDVGHHSRIITFPVGYSLYQHQDYSNTNQVQQSGVTDKHGGVGTCENGQTKLFEVFLNYKFCVKVMVLVVRIL